MNNEWILTSPYAVYNHRLSLFGCVPLIHQVSESGRQFSPVTAPESVLVIFGNYQRKLGSNTSVLRTNRILRLEMMKGGARFRLDLDEGWCETLHYITIHHKGIDLDEGWCETLHYITIHHKGTDLDEGWCETLHYITIYHWLWWRVVWDFITIHQKRIDLDEGWCESLHCITIHQKRTDFDEGWCVFCN